MSVVLLLGLALATLLPFASPPDVFAAETTPASIAGVVMSSSAYLPVPGALVELWEADSGGSWRVVATVAADSTGWFEAIRESTVPVRVRVTDPSAMHAPAWFGGQDLATAADVVSGWDMGSFVDVTLPLINPAVIRGTVASSYSGIGVADISVSLFLDSDGFVAFQTTSDAEGAYRFEAVPPGVYALRVTDLGARYFTKWWENASTIATATHVVIGSPMTTIIHPRMDPRRSSVRFGVTGVSSWEQLTPYLGQTIRIETTVIGTPEYGALVPAMLSMEYSLDGANWSKWTGPLVMDSAGGGVFGASLALSTTQATYFRFRWAESEFYRGATSESEVVTARIDPNLATWTPTVVKPTSRTSSIHPFSIPGTVIIESMLVGADGTPEMLTWGIPQYSDDGINWTNVKGYGDYPKWVTIDAAGVRQCYVEVYERTYFRYWSPRAGHPEGQASEPVIVTPQASITISAWPQSVRAPKPFVLSGNLLPAHIGEPCIVEVRKPGSARWSYSSARLVYQLDSPYAGVWWYRYTPRLRGTYWFRVRYRGGVSGLACVSSALTVRVR